MAAFVKKCIKSLIPKASFRSISRVSLDMELRKHLRRLKPGIVLDVGSKYSPYKEEIPCTKYLRLDIDKNSKPDICCDLHKIKWKSGYFDTIIATEVLEHLYDPQKAINEIHRILKKGGICILTTRFMCLYHPDPKDYYRFTKDSLAYLFRRFSKVGIYHHGNRLQVLWHIINTGKLSLLLNLLNPLIARIRFKETNYPSGYLVFAKK
ncbi:MAG: class I SAM-dependent methyltransferase [Candidatus Woesearchaeota archaeon]